MKSILPLSTKFGANLISKPAIKSILPVCSWWEFEHYRKGKLIDAWEQKNVNTTEGLNHILNVAFNSATQITSWYMGLFEDDYTPLIGDTYAVPGFTESTAYDEATRIAYVDATSTTKVMTNSASKATFTISGTKTIYGAFLCGGGTGAATKSDVAGGGTLFAASKFATAKDVVDDDILMCVCSITLADV
ncbi:MAG: hypothetical protein PHN44_10440 [Candidatus Marinimicrobia bacterium]|jgi:hypothetical protein|nr:hypothetical protein [Candidatus Neomarinimicrobiota bacterium]